jgi:cystathionine beta-synthase
MSSLLDLIGNTPLLELTRFDTGPCRLFVKLESQNPGGSIKDRIALAMVEAAERDGRLQPGGLLVEATSGNTGIALAMVAALRGYRLLLVVFDKTSTEKIALLRAMGAEVIVTRSDVQAGHPEYYRDMAARLACELPGAVLVNQFGNPANPAAHEATTGPEIWAQTEGKVGAVVTGIGSGGTLTGTGRYFARVAPTVEMVLADPLGSGLAALTGLGPPPPDDAAWLVEGIGQHEAPEVCDLSLVKQSYSIDDAESIATARALLRQEGILCGPSSGTLIAAALRYCRDQTDPKTVVTFVCDSGSKYLSKLYNPDWLRANGFSEDL